MNVYLLTEGDGSDGDETRVIGVYASRDMARAEAEKCCRATRPGAPMMPYWGGDDWGRWQVEEWLVLTASPSESTP